MAVKLTDKYIEEKNKINIDERHRCIHVNISLWTFQAFSDQMSNIFMDLFENHL